MAGNNFSSKGDATLVALVTQMAAKFVATPAAYGLTAPQATGLNDAVEDLQAKINGAEAARIAFGNATDEKTTSRSTLLSELGKLTGIVYAYPGITSAALTAAGLAVHSTTKSAKVPATPRMTNATPFATGVVELKWLRGRNQYGITFMIESKSETGNWTTVGSTTATKIRLNGYTPGVPMWFRIVATHGGVTAVPSLPVPIYHEESGVSLSIAA